MNSKPALTENRGARDVRRYRRDDRLRPRIRRTVTSRRPNGGGIAFAENECPGHSGWHLSPGGDMNTLVGMCVAAFYAEGPGTRLQHPRSLHQHDGHVREARLRHLSSDQRRRHDHPGLRQLTSRSKPGCRCGAPAAGASSCGSTASANRRRASSRSSRSCRSSRTRLIDLPGYGRSPWPTSRSASRRSPIISRRGCKSGRSPR